MTNWIAIIISVLLAALAVYKEVVRANRARLAMRIIAVMVAVTALACLVLPVRYQHKIQGDSGRVFLLTTGSLKTGYAFMDGQKAYTLDSNIAKSVRSVKMISNPAEILAENTGKPELVIYGYGLNHNNLSELGNARIIFDTVATPDGITAVSWTQIINTGQSFHLQGTIKNTGKPYKLLLKGLNTVLDSVKIGTGSSISFSMSNLPKQIGKVVYNLVGMREKDTLFDEQIPVVIQPAQPLKILMLSAAPDFENKFLRMWLGNNNYAVASRAIITKSKIGQDYFNMERIDLSRITQSLLTKFDVVEADLSAIKMLTSAENSALQQEVSNKGLGLIIRADSVDDKSASWVQSIFETVKLTKQSATELLINGKKTAKYILDPQYISRKNNIQPVVEDDHGNLISAVTLSGSGRLLLSTINNSYSWTLAGNNADYAAYWSALINKVARRAKAESNWSVATLLPTPGEPVNLLYHSAELNRQSFINQSAVSPVQNPGMPFERRFTYWPSQIGWQQAVANNGAPYWWFVWPKSSWAALHATENTRITTEYASKSTKRSSFSDTKQQKAEVEISKFYFYILLLVSATFLWAETKYSIAN